MIGEINNENIGITLRLHLTSACNLNCDYCYEDKTIKKRFMSLFNFKLILEIFKDVKIKRLYLYGGEPLLNTEIINYLVSLGKLPININSIGMTTNGTFLTKDIINYLENNNSSINISIDGDKNVHNMKRKFQNGNGSFDKIIENISNINDFSKFNVSMTFGPDTVDYIFDSVVFIKKLGFKNFGINFLYEEKWDLNIFKNLISNLIKARKYKILKFDDFYNELNYGSGLTCKEHMLDSMSIGPNLEVLPCGYWWSKVINSSKYINVHNLGKLTAEFNFRYELEKQIFNNESISSIMKKGRICEVIGSTNFLKNKKQIYFILKSIFN